LLWSEGFSELARDGLMRAVEAAAARPLEMSLRVIFMGSTLPGV